MSNADDTHFDTYREQTRIKHVILERYLKAYFNVLKKGYQRILYIDGFAGSGHYTTRGDEGKSAMAEGSPIRALRLISENDGLPERVRCLFIESNAVYAEQLRAAAEAFCRRHPTIAKPIIEQGRFRDVVEGLIDRVDSLAPTFLFVDPCGVDGVSMRAIQRILENRSCEILLFFNIDGVRRIAGLMRDRDSSPTLVDLFGSEARARACSEEFLSATESDERERIILDHYRRALEEATSARFFLRFRVEHEDRAITSHYLLHATSHPLGFRIMKHVMWEAGRNPGESEGSLELLQASAERTATLFRPDIETLKTRILEHLGSNGPETVQAFREVWTEHPQDMFSDAVYRRVLLELEAQGKIEAVDPKSGEVIGSDDRPKRNGEPTLATRFLVRLRT